VKFGMATYHNREISSASQQLQTWGRCKTLSLCPTN